MIQKADPLARTQRLFRVLSSSLLVELLSVLAGCATHSHGVESLGGQNDVPDLTLIQGQKIIHQASPPPFGRIVSNKPGYLESPYNPDMLVDVYGLATGTWVVDPLCKKPFVVPPMIYIAPPYRPPPPSDGKMVIERGLRK
jgi:hypothetical protein